MSEYLDTLRTSCVGPSRLSRLLVCASCHWAQDQRCDRGDILEETRGPGDNGRVTIPTGTDGKWQAQTTRNMCVRLHSLAYYVMPVSAARSGLGQLYWVRYLPIILPTGVVPPAHLVGDHKHRAAHARLHRAADVYRHELAHQVGPLRLELERVHAAEVVGDQDDGLPVPHPLHRALDPLHHLLRRVTPLFHVGVVAAEAGQICGDAPEPIFQVGNL